MLTPWGCRAIGGNPVCTYCRPDHTPWKESYDQPRQHSKKQRHYSANKGPSSQGNGFSCGQYGCESWTVKKASSQHLANQKRVGKVCRLIGDCSQGWATKTEISPHLSQPVSKQPWAKKRGEMPRLRGWNPSLRGRPSTGTQFRRPPPPLPLAWF